MSPNVIGTEASEVSYRQKKLHIETNMSDTMNTLEDITQAGGKGNGIASALEVESLCSSPSNSRYDNFEMHMGDDDQPYSIDLKTSGLHDENPANSVIFDDSSPRYKDLKSPKSFTDELSAESSPPHGALLGLRVVRGT